MVLARNTVFEESVELGFNNRTKKVRVSKKLKPLAIIKLSEPSAPLTPDEQETINSMTGVNWKPRQKYKGFKFNREPLQWEALGFVSEHHYSHWLYFQQLSNEQYDADFIDVVNNGISD
ncbi:hypothetical protein [Klebsiella pneumoniae]|uniref:hypothetical protein n=1 Tax=Klebsiella pneumoniae TaxID=573 RepID=UPI000E2C6EBC|nr:hypothetical protein [Klebsiella pneumoniae]SVZ52373.1 Uncharacterised protein [Klebsiella pneumoniae]HBS6027218.1 hypothetical protein [Klebsiella pneumoniae]HBS6120171.1 hypothetical protein [Klebsiella pneumoniae]